MARAVPSRFPAIGRCRIGRCTRPDTASLEVRETIDRTQDCDLFATLRSDATVETLKLLIPGFELLEELGRSAFGVVYRARDEAARTAK
ncbi:MAG: hypothetical protein R3C56_35705 [Pirellulaceae bacterium]